MTSDDLIRAFDALRLDGRAIRLECLKIASRDVTNPKSLIDKARDLEEYVLAGNRSKRSPGRPAGKSASARAA